MQTQNKMFRTLQNHWIHIRIGCLLLLHPHLCALLLLGCGRLRWWLVGVFCLADVLRRRLAQHALLGDQHGLDVRAGHLEHGVQEKSFLLSRHANRISRD